MSSRCECPTIFHSSGCANIRLPTLGKSFQVIKKHLRGPWPKAAERNFGGMIFAPALQGYSICESDLGARIRQSSIAGGRSTEPCRLHRAQHLLPSQSPIMVCMRYEMECHRLRASRLLSSPSSWHSLSSNSKTQIRREVRCDACSARQISRLWLADLSSSMMFGPQGKVVSFADATKLYENSHLALAAIMNCLHEPWATTDPFVDFSMNTGR